MRYLTLGEVLELHRRLLSRPADRVGLRDLNALEAAIALPRQTFDGQDLYPDLAAKAAILGFALIQNHAFIDGNKRIGHAALETFLWLNGAALDATVDDAEATVLAVAGGTVSREQFTVWVATNMVRRTDT